MSQLNDDRIATAADFQGALKKALAGKDAEHARTMHMATKMGDLPEVYRNQLPTTADPDQLYQSEQAIRKQYIADMKTHAGQFVQAAIQKNASTAGAADAPIDLSKMSTTDLLTMGLKQSKPSRVGGK